ncbi:hypothetical protein PGTUg99_033322 [Puccinia graminis f. sp. tritici]|uniref:Uncharacterized protein n=1 Tax=Puccinia graminis f. sp. tritici TaxID=56615 RepID=A0A5B0PLE1_PUCGR|nr:hypothetical protein PGTUg99_033322 [Puccinia graminis f. sp. tritici]
MIKTTFAHQILSAFSRYFKEVCSDSIYALGTWWTCCENWCNCGQGKHYHKVVDCDHG